MHAFLVQNWRRVREESDGIRGTRIYPRWEARERERRKRWGRTHKDKERLSPCILPFRSTCAHGCPPTSGPPRVRPTPRRHAPLDVVPKLKRNRSARLMPRRSQPGPPLPRNQLTLTPPMLLALPSGRVRLSTHAAKRDARPADDTSSFFSSVSNILEES